MTEPTCATRMPAMFTRDSVLSAVTTIAHGFASQRSLRQQRRELDALDFDALRQAGFARATIPVESGGLFTDTRGSVRFLAELLRILATGDSSVALVAAMHPAVISYWLVLAEIAGAKREQWIAQRDRISLAVRGGAWFGTITSEPGSGGDIAKTKAVAIPGADGGPWELTGAKHFGSGSGITSFMVTTARVGGIGAPDIFLLDTRTTDWSGASGMKLVAPWDGHGMTATQSHAFQFTSFPAERHAFADSLEFILAASGGFIGCLFAAVFVGIVETAVAEAERALTPRRADLRPFEQFAWTQAVTDAWLVRQAYEGMLRSVEADGGTPVDVLRGKAAIAELAESTLRNLCTVVGGGTYSRRSPFGFWFEDVRALGFLRPPLPLLHDRLFRASFAATASSAQDV